MTGKIKKVGNSSAFASLVTTAHAHGTKLVVAIDVPDFSSGRGNRAEEREVPAQVTDAQVAQAAGQRKPEDLASHTQRAGCHAWEVGRLSMSCRRLSRRKSDNQHGSWERCDDARQLVWWHFSAMPEGVTDYTTTAETVDGGRRRPWVGDGTDRL